MLYALNARSVIGTTGVRSSELLSLMDTLLFTIPSEA